MFKLLTLVTLALVTKRGLSVGSGLNDKFVSHGKKFWGTIADPIALNNTIYTNILKSDFGQVTPENSMKWDATEASQGIFSFDRADKVVDWAVSNGKLIRGHNLVWHSQLPSWVSYITDKDSLTSVIKNHISTVAGRYKGKIYSWDVCYEVLNEDGSLRNSVFHHVLGESFITIAYETARAADEGAKLYITDYNIDSNNAKAQGMVRLVNRINASQKYIDGIGTEMHLDIGEASGVQDALTLLASAGVDIAIHELDIVYAAPEDYLAVTEACLNTPACVAITSWGISDGGSWRAQKNPLLFDEEFQPKPAYHAIINTL